MGSVIVPVNNLSWWTFIFWEIGMRGEWVYNKHYFSKEFCNKTIESALKLPPESPTIGFSSGIADNSFRRSVIRWIDSEDPKFKFISDPYWELMRKINLDWFGFHVNKLPPIQFTEYDESYQGEYKSHQDIFWTAPTTTHRKISFITQLSDETTYSGGDLVLENLTELPPAEDIRLQGTAILFPSFVYHRLTPVTRGKRYSLVGWFEGPRFV
jgi:PKHD-type hydroxylase